MPNVSPPAWHVDSVSERDDRMLREIMECREKVTGDHQTKSGTIKRAIRALYRREVTGK